MKPEDGNRMCCKSLICSLLASVVAIVLWLGTATEVFFHELDT